MLAEEYRAAHLKNNPDYPQVSEVYTENGATSDLLLILFAVHCGQGHRNSAGGRRNGQDMQHQR